MGPHNFQKILFDLLTFHPDQGNAGIREATKMYGLNIRQICLHSLSLLYMY